jgi:hypothetical protein
LDRTEPRPLSARPPAGALDVSRFGRRVGRLAHSELREVDEALQLVLGLF